MKLLLIGAVFFAGVIAGKADAKTMLHTVSGYATIKSL